MTAVLCLALAGAAHAFTVEIVVPSTDPVLIATDRPQAFEAVAYDGQQDITAQVTWSWDFDDGSAADTDNPTEHVFETAGDYTVTVTATFSAQQEQQQIGVDAQQPTGAFVLARQLPTGAYESLQGTEVCHHRYLIAFDAVPRNYDGVRFKSKRAWEQEFGVGTWVSPSQEIVLDGQLRPQAWVLFWSTSECPGQAVVGEPNGAVDWQIAGKYLEGVPPEDVEVEELIGEPTYTINNTVVSSASGVLLFDPEDEELDSCEISWTTGHQSVFGVKFTVPIHIYDLAGNELYTYTETDVPLGGGSSIWDGTIFEQEPEGPTTASQGIYTYRLGVVGSQGTCGGVHCACTEPGEGCARGDWDKSAFLTVAIGKFYWFEQDPVAGTLRGVVRYTLNQDAWPGSVTIRFFGPDLEELDYPLTDQPHLAGTHFSDVYQIDAQYDENDALIGPIYCVIYANECEDTALLNRAGDSKPALQMGTTTLVQLLNLTGGTLIDPPLTEHEEEDPGAFVHYNIDNDDWSDNTVGLPKHPGSDLLQQEDPVTGEDDLLPATATFDTTVQWGKVALVRTGDAILVWTDAAKGEDDALLVEDASHVWDLSVPAEYAAFHALKSSLFVEGAEYNGEADLKLQFLRPDDTLICEDVVHYTAIAANCGIQPPTDEGIRDTWEQGCPHLARCEWSILAPSHPAFNCIAWSVGRYDLWINDVGPYTRYAVASIDRVWGDQDGICEDWEVDRFYANTPYYYIGDEHPEDDPEWGPDPWVWLTGAGQAVIFEPLIDDPEPYKNADVMYYDGFHGAESWRATCACGAGQWFIYRSKCGDGALVEHRHYGINYAQPPGAGGNYGVPYLYYVIGGEAP